MSIEARRLGGVTSNIAGHLSSEHPDVPVSTHPVFADGANAAAHEDAHRGNSRLNPAGKPDKPHTHQDPPRRVIKAVLRVVA